SGSFAAPKYLPEPSSSGRTCRTTPLTHRCSASEGPSTTGRPGGGRVGCPRPAPGPPGGGPRPPPGGGVRTPPSRGVPGGPNGGPPRGGPGGGGGAPLSPPPGSPPPPGGSKMPFLGGI